MGRNKNKNKNEKPKEPVESDVEETETEDGEEGEGEAGVGENAVVDMDEGGDDEAEDEGDDKEPTPEEKNALAQHQSKESERKLSKDEAAHLHLDKLHEFINRKNNKPEHMEQDHGIKLVHFHTIQEMADKKKKGRLDSFSDGHREMLRLNYERLVKANKIK